MSFVYFIGDTHFGHKNVCNFRTQFSTVEDHDQFIIDQIMTTVSKRDTLWLMGDLFFTRESIKYFHQMNDKFNVRVVLGNHETDSAERRMILVDIINSGVQVHAVTSFRDCLLSHAPIHPDQMRGKSLNIHGHMHDKVLDDKLYFNVSCENIEYKPIKFSEIMERSKL